MRCNKTNQSDSQQRQHRRLGYDRWCAIAPEAVAAVVSAAGVAVEGVAIVGDRIGIHRHCRIQRNGPPAQNLGGSTVFIAGGAEIYRQALPLCGELLLTLVKRDVEGDAFFPPFEEQFELVEKIRETPEFKILRYRRR